ncbi:MAG: cupin domain-containing protein [Acidobacteria bacterium]|nr:cupin domain-containing protein [Acidobacteriota bacterium]
MSGRVKRVLGDRFGIAAFGVNLVTLEPGAASALFHRHSLQDEFIFVIAGEVTLIHDAGETIMRAGDCVGFPHQGTAHCFVNHSNAAASYLEVGDRVRGDSATYPRDDLIAEHGADGWRFTHRDGRPY